MGCSRSVVAAVNRRHQIRDYAGRRSCWNLNPALAGSNGELKAS
jgi:hypothetical protein